MVADVDSKFIQHNFMQYLSSTECTSIW